MKHAGKLVSGWKDGRGKAIRVGDMIYFWNCGGACKESAARFDPNECTDKSEKYGKVLYSEKYPYPYFCWTKHYERGKLVSEYATVVLANENTVIINR